MEYHWSAGCLYFLMQRSDKNKAAFKWAALFFLRNRKSCWIKTLLMQKYFLLFIVLFFASLYPDVVAQQKTKNLSGSIAASMAVPVYNLAYTSIGAGLNITVLYAMNKSVAINADAGYTGLVGKKYFPSISLIPIRVGLQYRMDEKIFAEGKMGLGILSLGNVNTNYAAYSVGIGYDLSPRFYMRAHYDGFAKKASSFGYAAIGIGYVFCK